MSILQRKMTKESLIKTKLLCYTTKYKPKCDEIRKSFFNRIILVVIPPLGFVVLLLQLIYWPYHFTQTYHHHSFAHHVVGYVILTQFEAHF